jgi:hypothetical protein
MSVSACGGDSAQYLVRVENSRAVAITVRIGPADYGSVAPQTTTDYKEVSEGENVVLVSGVESPNSPASFGEGLTGTHRWTYFFREDSEGFSTDDPIFRIAALIREQAVRW